MHFLVLILLLIWLLGFFLFIEVAFALSQVVLIVILLARILKLVIFKNILLAVFTLLICVFRSLIVLLLLGIILIVSFLEILIDILLIFFLGIVEAQVFLLLFCMRLRILHLLVIGSLF